MIVIDGTTYNVPVLSLKRTADFLDKYAERTEDGVLHRKLIGVYFNYELQLGFSHSTSEYASLWDKLTEPIEYHTVTVPDELGDYTFTAYFSSVSDEMYQKDKYGNHFKNLTVKFISKSPARS